MRYFLAIVAVIVLFLLIITIVKFIQDNSENKKIKKRLKNVFKELENDYENFIQRILDYELIKNENFNLDIQQITSQAITIFKPYIESLFAIANSTKITKSLNLHIKSEHFKNLYFITEKLLMYKLPLTTFEKDELYQAFTNAIKADISKRLLQLQTGI